MFCAFLSIFFSNLQLISVSTFSPLSFHPFFFFFFPGSSSQWEVVGGSVLRTGRYFLALQALSLIQEDQSLFSEVPFITMTPPVSGGASAELAEFDRMWSLPSTSCLNISPQPTNGCDSFLLVCSHNSVTHKELSPQQTSSSGLLNITTTFVWAFLHVHRLWRFGIFEVSIGLNSLECVRTFVAGDVFLLADWAAHVTRIE